MNFESDKKEEIELKKIIVLVLLLFLAACSETEQNKTVKSTDQEESKTQVEETSKTTDQQKDTKAKEDQASETETKNEIDTSMFTAENVEVTDAIDINQHITLMIDVNNSVKPGMAFQNVTNQAYDFLTQSSVEGAKTITIAVRQDGNKIVQFTVDKDKFVQDDNTPMAQLVLNASVVEMASPEVEEYATVMELPLNKE